MYYKTILLLTGLTIFYSISSPDGLSEKEYMHKPLVSLPGQIFIPVASEDRKDISQIHLTQIGQFGLMRKARAGIPEHYHTGIDIKRPGSNYEAEPVLPISMGRVISKRTDGPYANLIIECDLNGSKFWTLYEHIAGIKVNVNEVVNPKNAIARFMNKNELNHFGWQFDHFHFELLKIKPQAIKPGKNTPERFFNSYTLTCYTKKDLNKYYANPMEYFKFHINLR